MEKNDVLELYREHKDMVFRLAVSYLKNTVDAEDAVQSVFLKLFDHKVVFVDGKARALLIKMTSNYCRNVLKSVWRKRVEPLYDDIIFREESDKELFEAVMGLKESYRVAIYLHYYEGYSFNEIAQLLNITESGVSMRIHRAKKILKTKLEVTL